MPRSQAAKPNAVLHGDSHWSGVAPTFAVTKVVVLVAPGACEGNTYIGMKPSDVPWMPKPASLMTTPSEPPSRSACDVAPAGVKNATCAGRGNTHSLS